MRKRKMGLGIGSSPETLHNRPRASRSSKGKTVLRGVLLIPFIISLKARHFKTDSDRHLSDGPAATGLEDFSALRIHSRSSCHWRTRTSFSMYKGDRRARTAKGIG